MGQGVEFASGRVKLDHSSHGGHKVTFALLKALRVRGLTSLAVKVTCVMLATLCNFVTKVTLAGFFLFGGRVNCTDIFTRASNEPGQVALIIIIFKLVLVVFSPSTFRQNLKSLVARCTSWIITFTFTFCLFNYPKHWPCPVLSSSGCTHCDLRQLQLGERKLVENVKHKIKCGSGYFGLMGQSCTLPLTMDRGAFYFAFVVLFVVRCLSRQPTNLTGPSCLSLCDPFLSWLLLP